MPDGIRAKAAAILAAVSDAQTTAGRTQTADPAMTGASDSAAEGTMLAPPVETVNACLCGSRRHERVSRAIDRLHRLPGSFEFVRCTRCMLVRLSPRPAADGIGFYYPPEEYYSLADPAASDDRSSIVRRTARLRSRLRDAVLVQLGYPVTAERKVHRMTNRLLRGPLRGGAPYGMGRRFPPFVPDGTVLDIGCGNAVFLSHLKRHGWKVAGVDVSPRAAEVAKSAFDIDVFVGELSEAGFAAGSFDVVQLSHVIEHVTDPRKLMAKVAELVKPNGRIYVETPNVDSFACRRAGDYWVPWEAPRHLYLFAPTTLGALVDGAGLRVEQMSTVNFGHLSWEETYRQEERVGHPLPGRPHVAPGRRPLLAVRSAADLIARTVRPMSGEILSCWATRART